MQCKIELQVNTPDIDSIVARQEQATHLPCEGLLSRSYRFQKDQTYLLLPPLIQHDRAISGYRSSHIPSWRSSCWFSPISRQGQGKVPESMRCDCSGPSAGPMLARKAQAETAVRPAGVVPAAGCCNHIVALGSKHIIPERNLPVCPPRDSPRVRVGNRWSVLESCAGQTPRPLLRFVPSVLYCTYESPRLSKFSP